MTDNKVGNKSYAELKAEYVAQRDGLIESVREKFGNSLDADIYELVNGTNKIFNNIISIRYETAAEMRGGIFSANSDFYHMTILSCNLMGKLQEELNKPDINYIKWEAGKADGGTEIVELTGKEAVEKAIHDIRASLESRTKVVGGNIVAGFLSRIGMNGSSQRER